MKFNVGDKVKVKRSNDNENYKDFKNKVLIVTYRTNDKKANGYDYGLYPQGLYSFKTEEGENIPYSLYDYELTLIKRG